ncbi:uncharacterized protein TNCV_579761 [Trichonephila clavipes]|nr:uncharacterized protein TNCV_579761 [Trichonephila clavipes]
MMSRSWGSNKTAQHVTQLVPQSIYYKDTFDDRLISRFGPANWPLRSCDSTPLDYFLWGYVKSLVYAGISHKRLTIWKTTFAVLLPIYGHKCWKTSSKIGRPDWTTSEPAVAVLCQKSYFKM